MKAIIHHSDIGGTAAAPASKSHAHRLLICAAFSSEQSSVVCPDAGDDVLATVSCLNALGAEIVQNGSVFTVKPINMPSNGAEIDCRESGSTLRFLLPVICALGIDCRIFMSDRLARRPLMPLCDELVRHGAVISGAGTSLLTVSGGLRDFEFRIPGNVSSQFISGLLLAAAVHGSGKVNITSKLCSANYVDITLRCLETADLRIKRESGRISVCGKPHMKGSHSVEGDWSNAAFWLCAGAIGKKPVSVTGLDLSSAQGDKKILDILYAFGADIAISGNIITVYPSPLRAADIDAADVPDLVPAVSLLCAAADGDSRIYNAARLRDKESDRLTALSSVLSALGADVSETEDGLLIHGGRTLHGARVSSFGDHRIAMTATVASLICDTPVEIDAAEAIGKSYPRFFDDFAALGGRLELT